ncbi:autoinducer binding domain-containing protein [Variovorax sp. J22P168]|uniref:autoinducer binding domain-containing protein n=1 Tax=Variovorax jilinensis TaxID=3053513 RepID=UPI0025749A5F|nr:autoinducer binding domain-containing protein [Variovorax sp. J22P168]MDM0012482.1 autoinducer binding domain-containing protein [Variovorax sp. J22P168]
MNAWAADLLDDLRHVKGAEAVFSRIARCARQLGFERCAYGLRRPLPFSNPHLEWVSDYDPRWQVRYAEAGYLRVDPTVRHALRSHRPVVWSDALLPAARALWDEACGFGLRIGWSQSRFDADGSVAMLSLARAHESLAHAELAAGQPQWRLLVDIAHEALSDALTAGACHAIPPLTRREIEVLRWTADGKTSCETGDILGVSEDTADFHVRNAVRKLGVSTRASAAARAAVLGLLR